MERNNCTNNQNVTPTSTKLFEGKSMEEIIRIAQDTVPGASSKTFQETIDVLKAISSNALVYCAESANAGIDYEVAIESIKRIQADAERANAREKEWMSIGMDKVWMPVYSYCKAISSSVYTDPIKNMAFAIMGALTASDDDDKVHTSTVLSLKLTQAYAASNDNEAFIRQLNIIREYMTTIVLANDKKDGGNTGYYWLQDIEYTIVTWIDTIKPIIK